MSRTMKGAWSQNAYYKSSGWGNTDFWSSRGDSYSHSRSNSSYVKKRTAKIERRESKKLEVVNA